MLIGGHDRFGVGYHLSRGQSIQANEAFSCHTSSCIECDRHSIDERSNFSADETTGSKQSQRRLGIDGAIHLSCVGLVDMEYCNEDFRFLHAKGVVDSHAQFRGNAHQ